MKRRILSLSLALILVFSVLALPASAASAKEVHTYLKNIAMSGQHDAENGYYYDGFFITDDNSLYYGVFYLEDSKYIQVSVIANSFEVTWRISSNPSPAYNAFIMVYDEQNTKGTVSLGANYNGSDYSSFKNFSGNTGLKADMLEVLNYYLPVVVEFTRAVINENDYTLANLGITGYKTCKYVHAYDKGTVSLSPTCAQSGIMTYTCRVCGNQYSSEIAATGAHKWDGGTVIVYPSCTQPGTKRYFCTVCHTASKDEEVPALGHKWNSGEVFEPAQCETEGIYRYTCTRCPQTKDQVLPALGHLWTYEEELTAPTEEQGLHGGTGRYKCTRCETSKEAPLCACEVFSDAPEEGHWAHSSIDWAFFNGITSGMGNGLFGTYNTCTREQIMTFLWVARGRPGHAEDVESPFPDVQPGAWFYDAVLWAVENGITSGMPDGSFGVGLPCTRAQAMTFLWASQDRPAPETDGSPFDDVPEGSWYYDSIRWAVENHITSGIGNNLFGVDSPCVRAQIVTFLHKVLAQ